MELPDYIRRPIHAAAERGIYRDRVVIGFVAPTSLAWFAKVDDAGRIVDGVARMVTPAQYREWADKLAKEAAQRGVPLAVRDLDDETFAAAVAARGRLN